MQSVCPRLTRPCYSIKRNPRYSLLFSVNRGRGEDLRLTLQLRLGRPQRNLLEWYEACPQEIRQSHEDR
jgi:hypothetical protein